MKTLGTLASDQKMALIGTFNIQFWQFDDVFLVIAAQRASAVSFVSLLRLRVVRILQLQNGLRLD
jgi:hypothetical protein